MGDIHTPLCQQLNRSGVPFQIAVANHVRTIAGAKNPRAPNELMIVEVIGEVPVHEDFIDLTARIGQSLFVFECKRMDGARWIFPVLRNENTNETRCRLEFFNGNFQRVPLHGDDPVFCDDWNLAVGSPVSDFCVVPKEGSNDLIETTCRRVLGHCHQLLGEQDIALGTITIAIPVLVTTAELYTCSMSAETVDLKSGKLDDDAGEFSSTDFVRFTKSFVSQRSNPYDAEQTDLLTWTMDRQRTVFVMNPSALERFFDAFRSFYPIRGRFFPAAFVNPPVVDDHLP